MGVTLWLTGLLAYVLSAFFYHISPKHVGFFKNIASFQESSTCPRAKLPNALTKNKDYQQELLIICEYLPKKDISSPRRNIICLPKESFLLESDKLSELSMILNPHSSCITALRKYQKLSEARVICVKQLLQH